MSAVRVTVRMYQGLLGDCFLLRLFQGDDDGRQRQADAHILIDCGILQRAPEEGDRIARVIADIAQSCGNRLDLVVVTHEHYDHICGFGAAGRVLLDTIQIDHLWLAWTEDPDDPDAQRLRALSDDSRMAIQLGMERLAAQAGLAADQDRQLPGDALGLDDFIGPLAAAPGKLPSREILEALKSKVGRDRITFLKPQSDPVRTPGRDGIAIDAFVLGPPKAADRLFQANATKAGAETYMAAREAEVRSASRLFAAAEEAGVGIDGVPFASRYRQLADTVLLDPALPLPGASDGAPAQRLAEIVTRYTGRGKPEDQTEDWRRIDTDWLSAVSGMALKLDSDTNNTSLVLAFELEPGGKVMLFAADAQVGNWLSWHDPLVIDGAEIARQPSAADLLARTTLYKVGHHCSHNATLRAKGLELMTDPDLVAMIPVVEEVAQRRRWRMPAANLYARLLEKTQGRVLRGDQPAPFARFTAPGPDASRVREASGDGALGALWVEYDAS